MSAARVKEPPPSAPWVETDRLDERLASAGATPAQAAAARSLAADGFAVLRFEDAGVPALCEAAIAEAHRVFANPAVDRVQNAWLASPAVRRLAGLPEVVDFLRLAYGREPFPFQTLNFERGSEQHPHADSMHFHTIPERFMCGVWLALEDVAEDAGPLIYYPGSHRLPVLTMRDVGAGEPPPFAELYRDYSRFYEPAVDRIVAEHGLKPAYGLLKRGEALVWAANLLHGGAPIARPGATRRSLVTHYFFEDCLYFTPLRSDVEHGQLDIRLPIDVRTGRWRWPKRDGRPVWPGHRALLGALRQRVRRQPYVARLQG